MTTSTTSAQAHRAIGAAEAYLSSVPGQFQIATQTGAVVSALGSAQVQLADATLELAADPQRAVAVSAHTLKAKAALMSMPQQFNAFAGAGPVIAHLLAAGRALADALETLDRRCAAVADSARAALNRIPDQFVAVQHLGDIVGLLTGACLTLLAALRVLAGL